MYKKIKHYIAALLIAVTLVPVAVYAAPMGQFAAAPCKNTPILTIPSWWKGLQCEGKQPQITSLNDIWVIALNLVEAMIGAAAYVAVGFIIWGGFRYLKSRGDPALVTEAKMTIIYAVAGFGVALASTAIVLFVQGMFT